MDRQVRVVAASSLLVLASGLLSILLTKERLAGSSIGIVVGLFGAIGGLSAALLAVRALRRYPNSLLISLIGPPGVGKTVYLTFLFRELETGVRRQILFAPSGIETTKRVAANLALLQKGHFPAKTPINSEDLYEAVARFSGPFGRQYRMRVLDLPGEQFLDVASIGGNPTDFRHLLFSDALIFMVDCDRVIHSTPHQTTELENALIATLNLVIEMRSENPMALFRVPVALVFSKADVAWTSPEGEEAVLHRFDSFSAIARRRCRRFNYFFVSALGETPLEPDVPPSRIVPRRVTEPLMWLLQG